MHVDLHDLAARTRSGVFHGQRDRVLVTGKIAVGECSVGQPVPEREEHRDLLLFIIAVTDVDALGIVAVVKRAGEV